MFLFAHLGIGNQLVRPWTKNLTGKYFRRAVLVGTLLPDLIDKPIYYSVYYLSSLNIPIGPFGFITQTRTFGHTAIFLFALALLAFYRQSKLLAALALGTATHLVLDSWSDSFLHHHWMGGQTVLLWPFLGWQFPPDPYGGLTAHLSLVKRPVILYGEIIGIGLLAWDYWKRRHPELLQRKKLKRRKIIIPLD